MMEDKVVFEAVDHEDQKSDIPIVDKIKVRIIHYLVPVT